ncbi:polysaccharide lyase family 7 protein [uncultured Winogradskyella sp.]|uniref:polysaccharide lyase family 7 protein n=1 Tax=uncultured Winogradskyella sp. TaxID=395353 RepID=UPI002602DF45|nr:polysaccharide lyase family 7 protein [uncultured Winogradskyella sp.]
MRKFNNIIRLLSIVFLLLLIGQCSKSDVKESDSDYSNSGNDASHDNDLDSLTQYAEVNFSNWKLTLPIDANNNGSPDEYQPNELKNFGYQTLQPVIPYMYDDTADSSLVFFTFPDISTTNSSYSRTELRELINPNNSRENWTLLEGGEMVGRLKVEEVSENNSSNDDYHKVIVMQIHGVISEEDMETQGFSGNNGPPLIKIYWKNGYIWCHKKSLKDESTSGDDLYDVYNGTWTDIKDNLGYVGFEAFNFRITASDARIEVQLNDEIPIIYQDVSLNKWPFENYFKAGNYLNTTDDEAFSKIKYYSLTVTH